MQRGEPGTRRVSVPLSALAVLLAVLFACLLVIAWLLGRESGRRLAQEPGPAPAPTLAPAVLRPVPSSTPVATPVPLPTPATPPRVAPRAQPSATPVPTAVTPIASAGEAAAVAGYFQELESLSSARYWEDPEALAMSLVRELVGGGTSGVERLRRVQAELEASIRRMTVPEPCREHHRRSLELSEAAGGLLRSIAARAASGDLSGLMSAMAEAERLQAGAEELRRLENGLRRRYGLPPEPS